MSILPIGLNQSRQYTNVMHKIVYHLKPEEKQDELEWLRDQMIFPAVEDYYDWKTQKMMVRFGIIVGSEAALTVKLRHKLDSQSDYRQR